MVLTRHLQIERKEFRVLAKLISDHMQPMHDSDDENPSYQLSAIELGKELVGRVINLVYEGKSIGLMV